MQTPLNNLLPHPPNHALRGVHTNNSTTVLSPGFVAYVPAHAKRKSLEKRAARNNRWCVSHLDCFVHKQINDLQDCFSSYLLPHICLLSITQHPLFLRLVPLTPAWFHSHSSHRSSISISPFRFRDQWLPRLINVAHRRARPGPLVSTLWTPLISSAIKSSPSFAGGPRL